MRQERVLVIGAGIGGLTCAIDLARAGMAVTVLERAATPGGKMREIEVDGVSVDSGPTVLTMPWVFEALFDACGASLGGHVQLRPLDVLARHAWGETERLDLYSDIDRSAEAIGAFAGAKEAAGYRAFSAQAQRIHDTLVGSFMTRQQTNPVGLAQQVGLARMDALLAIKPFETLWQALGVHFQDTRLRQLFGRYATYCGSSPFAAPATLMLIAHVEREGVWTVEGGMQRLAEALERLARALGVVFRYGAHAQEIHLDRGRASAVTLAGGERLDADSVVVNAGAGALAMGAFGPAVRDALGGPADSPRSLSAVTWTMRARARGFPLVRHNVFFSSDYAAEFHDILTQGRLPGEPTIYVCAQDRDDHGAAPGDLERLFVLINAPANGERGPWTDTARSACEAQVFERLARCGLVVDRADSRSVATTPADFHRIFPATGGALYGQATHGWAAAFKRPGARTRIPGLYLAGGGAHPGAGAPMAALSGRLAAQRVIQDRASTRTSRRGAMFGGTLTRSATTAGAASP